MRSVAMATIMIFLLVAGTGCGRPGFLGGKSGDTEVILATTTSVQDSGLLDVLLPMFKEQTGYNVKAIAVGTGAALEMGAQGNADVVLVHAPDAEKAWMAKGYGTERVLIAYNDFVIVGPEGDPAHIMGGKSAVEALKTIASAGATWISRDDKSGTDQLEKKLWKLAEIDPSGEAWYIRSGQGMGATLTLANQKSAYTLADRGTWLAFQDETDLPIMVEGDPALLNLYHVMPVDPTAFPNVSINQKGAGAFVTFLTDPKTQEVIGTFGVDIWGQPLFHPAAGKNEEELTGP